MTCEVAELCTLVWAPRGRDAALAAQLLQRNGFGAEAVGTIDELVTRLRLCACVIVTEEALVPAARAQLVQALGEQPAWSDLPVIIFAPRGADRVSDALALTGDFGNVTVLERPVQSRTLVSAVAAALRARRRQYEGRTAIARRDEFLAMLGHELRNPLAAITLAVEALRASDDASTARPREILHRQASHLTRLVDDLLDVARVTRGKLRLQRAHLDVGAVLARSVRSASELSERRGIRIALRAPAEPVHVDGDVVRLEEVFSNLLGNAIKYSPDGGQVTVELARGDGGCTVDVVDHGIGIAPDMLKSVFELFAQADATIDRSAGGLGIGLTVVKSLVELHGGTVQAYSDGLGTGSRFRVVLPVAAPSAQAIPAAGLAAPAPAANPGLRVLVVEDNPDLLALTAELVTALGCEVVTADTGTSAAALLHGAAFDVALLDVGLPGLDGYELARIARHLDTPPYVVAVTGYGQADDRARAVAAGFDRHLTKPVSLADLQAALAAGRERHVASR